MEITSLKKISAISFFLISFIAANTFAQGMAVPAKLQAALFKKIFSFDKTLSSKGSFEVAVLGNSGDAVVAAFKEAGVEAKITDQVPGSGVVYVMPGTASPKSQTASKGVLSISGVPQFAEEGKVAVGIGVEDGKPKIIIHMGQLKAEGHELSAELLKIAKIIQ